VSISIYI